MKRKFKFLGGNIMEAASAVELVEAMRTEHKKPTESTAHFMAQIAERCKQYNGADIRVTDPKAFIQDLQYHGYIMVALNGMLSGTDSKNRYPHDPPTQLVAKIAALDPFEQHELGRTGQHLFDMFWLPPYDATDKAKAFAVSEAIKTFKRLGLLE